MLIINFLNFRELHPATQAARVSATSHQAQVLLLNLARLKLVRPARVQVTTQELHWKSSCSHFAKSPKIKPFSRHLAAHEAASHTEYFYVN